LDKNREKEVSSSYSMLSKILTDVHWRYKKTQNGNATDINDKYNALASQLREVDAKSKLINSINATINAIACDDGEYTIDFLDTNEPYKSAFISKNLPDRQLIPSNLGSGYHVLFAYALARYIFELEKEPIIFLIDEPEMHLHIDWQLKLFQKFIEDKDIQIIYSTQSENFLSLKHWNKIRVLKDCVVFPKNETLEELTTVDSRSYPIKEIIQDYADRNLHVSTFLRDNLELLFSQKCILVEGPAEKYALPKLLNLLDCDISRYSVSVVPVWGKGKMKLYQMICKCFGANYYTLYDKDIKDGETFDNDKENQYIENNAANGHISSFSKSFESSLGVDGFQKVVKKTDEISSKEELAQELNSILSGIKTFIENLT
jgi:predicted ATP-dependent endonuclease of OLD family